MSDHVDSINESAKHLTSVTITFLVACVYVAIAVASTSHERLLLGWGEFSLPLFDAKIPLVEFYIVTPILLALLHLHLLLQEYFLIRKMLPYPSEAGDGLGKLFFPALLVTRMFGWHYHRTVRFLLRAVRWIINAVLPLALMIWIQAQFLPYHSPRITGFHRGVVMVDLAFVIIFRWLIAGHRKSHFGTSKAHEDQGPERGVTKPKSRTRQEIASVLWVLFSRLVSFAFIALVLYFCFFVAIVPGTMVEQRWPDRQFWWFSWPVKNLALGERTLVGGEARDSNPEHVIGVVLVNRDLRNADFTGASLVNADFRGANLDGAILRDADLRGAKLMPYGGFHGRFEVERGENKHLLIEEAHVKEKEFPPTSLERADLRGAKLQGANLILSHLRGARLSAAHLEGVEMTYADLREAEMVLARMSGVELWHARLDGANLSAADLQAANLELASLGGAVLTQAKLAKVNFRKADLSGARLTQADLEGANFWSSRLIGASLRGASLKGVRDLELRGMSLRQATVDAICQPRGIVRPYLVDFREIVSLSKVRLCAKGEVLQGESLRQRGLLYSDDDRQRVGFMSDWPPVQGQRFRQGVVWQEDEYYKELVDLLMEEVCRNPGLAVGLARDATEQASLEPRFQAYLKRRLVARLQELEKAEEARGEGKAVTVSPCRPLLDLPAEARAQIVAGATEPGREP